MWKFVVLTALVLLAGCRSRYACSADQDCSGGKVCVTFNLTADDFGSSCRTLCGSDCPSGESCGSCPESSQRCTLTDGGPSGGFCRTPNDTLYPLP